MPKFLIEPADLPAANLHLVTPISAGRGWLELAQKAVAIAAGEPIASIKEKAGLLDVHIFTREAAKFPRLHELRQASASICEICGEPGTLAYHQVRCEDHQGWRTSRPFPPDQLGYIEACEWENAPAMGLEYGSIVIDLQTRELTRRNALWALGNPKKREAATQDLLSVWRADRDCPIGPAAGLTIDEIRNLVQIHVEEGVSSLVRYSEIPEPWATRFQVASLGATRALDGYYARDWERFLDLWPAEAEQVEALVERELERQVIAGIQRAQARSAATLADLGIDLVELGEWVAEQVGKGRWPEGDFAEAFRVWRDQKNTSNAVPGSRP